jgi:hypothetical protein
MAARRNRLQPVVDRQWLYGPNRGLWDILACGHSVGFDGVEHRQRQCKACGPDDVAPGGAAETLFDEVAE